MLDAATYEKYIKKIYVLKNINHIAINLSSYNINGHNIKINIYIAMTLCMANQLQLFVIKNITPPLSTSITSHGYTE